MPRIARYSLGILAVVTSAISTVTTTSKAAESKRPVSYQLMPAETVAYIRVSSVQELVSRFQETSVGRIARQQQLKDLTQQLYTEAQGAFKPAEERVGLNLRQLLKLPQGEVTFAMVAPEAGPPSPVLMIDVGQQQANAKRLLDFLFAEMESNGRVKSARTVEGTQITELRKSGEKPEPLMFFMKDETVVVAADLEVVTQLLTVWSGDNEQAVLDDNEDFSLVMRRSNGPRGDSPQIRWYVDPIGLVKAAGRGNGGLQAAMLVLPVLGVDGLRGAGGSLTLASSEYDSYMQAHLLIDGKRMGVLAMLAMQDGDTTPEDWVPHTVANYQTMHWDLNQTLNEAEKLLDSFQGEGGFANNILQPISDRLGVDVTEEVLRALGGRFSLTTWFERPARPDNQAILAGVQLKEGVEFEETLEKIIETAVPKFEKKTYAGVSYFEITIPGTEDRNSSDERGSLPVRPCVAVVDDYVIAAERPRTLERAIVTLSDSSKSLANELDFKLVASKLKRQPGGTSPGVLIFERPEEGFRMLYELAMVDDTRRQLSDAARDNPFLTTLQQALDDNPLPPFSVIREFLAPTVTMITSDESGFHLTGFGLRRKGGAK